jgi:hypothetical protein
MFENMVFVWKFCFHFIFVWNMLNMCKYGHFWSVCSFLKSCVQFLVKQKGDAPMEHMSRILEKGDAILHENAPCTSAWHTHWHAYAKRMCTNWHAAARRKKHRVEQKMSKIFEAHRLSWVWKLVSITSSRQGGTKLLNHAGASGKGDAPSITHVLHMRKLRLARYNMRPAS